MKVCTKCKVEKSFDLFAKCSKHADGLAYKCKPCSYEYLKEYRKINFQKYNNKRNETLRLQRAGIYNLAETKRQKKINAQAHREYCEQNKLTLTKVCNICGTTKTLSKFDKSSKETDGFQHRCKQCNREWAKRHRVENPEKERARHKKYIEENRDKRREYEKQYAKNNPEKIRANSRRFYNTNKEKELERCKMWAKNNRKWMNHYSSLQRLLRKQAFASWANEEKIIALYDESYKKTIETGILHHVDHIIPIRSKYVCGLHCEDNLQVLTAHENVKKSNKFRPFVQIPYAL